MLHWRDQLESILQTPNPQTGACMQIGDILIDTRNNQVYIVKAFMPKYPKRVLLIDLDDGRTFTIQKVIARQWKPFTKETQ